VTSLDPTADALHVLLVGSRAFSNLGIRELGHGFTIYEDESTGFEDATIVKHEAVEFLATIRQTNPARAA
jgi:hypothetical protein